MIKHELGGDNLQPYFIPIFMMLVVLFILSKNRKLIIMKKLKQRRKTEDKTKMIELAKRFIGKECIIYSFDGHQFEGTILEVTNGALMIEKKGNPEAINLDFVMRIREYPRDKKGKKKSVVID